MNHEWVGHDMTMEGTEVTIACAHAVQVKASLIVVLTRGGSTARLVAKYRPAVPILTVAVPVLTTGATRPVSELQCNVVQEVSGDAEGGAVSR